MLTTAQFITNLHALTGVRLSPNTIWVQISKGRIRSTMHGRDHAIEESEVGRYAAESLGRFRKR